MAGAFNMRLRDSSHRCNPLSVLNLMELVHIDYVGMEVTVAAKEKPVVKNVLVVVDHFTWYVQAFVTKESYGKNDCLSAVQQLLFSIWFPAVPHVRSRYQILWERYCSYVQLTGH